MYRAPEAKKQEATPWAPLPPARRPGANSGAPPRPPWPVSPPAKEASPPRVNEVVARYLTALQADYGEGSDDTAFLPTMARTAASLGNFYQHWQQHGWEQALESLGVNQASLPNGEEIMSALLDRLAGPGDTLAAAVTRAALLDHLDAVLSPDMIPRHHPPI